MKVVFPFLKPLRVAIWVCLVVVAALLPFIANWVILDLGGYITDWIYYGNYRDLLSLSFLASAILFPWLMTKPSRFLGLRFTLSFVLIISYLLAAFVPRPMCPERIVLGAMKPSPHRAEAEDSCDIAPPPPLPPEPM